MENAFLEFIINLIVLVPIVILLIVISLKLSKGGLNKLASGSYVKVLERFNLNKDTCIYVIKTGKTGCVIVSSNNNTQVIKELDESEINEILRMKKEKNDSTYLNKLNFSKILNNKLTREKEDGHIKSDFK